MDDSFIAIIRDYLKIIYFPSPPAFSRARITRAHYRDFALFAFTTFTQGDCFIAILGEKKRGRKKKKRGRFLRKSPTFFGKSPTFLKKGQRILFMAPNL